MTINQGRFIVTAFHLKMKEVWIFQVPEKGDVVMDGQGNAVENLPVTIDGETLTFDNGVIVQAADVLKDTDCGFSPDTGSFTGHTAFTDPNTGQPFLLEFTKVQ